jgi:hypothetical protein
VRVLGGAIFEDESDVVADAVELVEEAARLMDVDVDANVSGGLLDVAVLLDEPSWTPVPTVPSALMQEPTPSRCARNVFLGLDPLKDPSRHKETRVEHGGGKKKASSWT